MPFVYKRPIVYPIQNIVDNTFLITYPTFVRKRTNATERNIKFIGYATDNTDDANSYTYEYYLDQNGTNRFRGLKFDPIPGEAVLNYSLSEQSRISETPTAKMANSNFFFQYNGLNFSMDLTYNKMNTQNVVFKTVNDRRSYQIISIDYKVLFSAYYYENRPKMKSYSSIVEIDANHNVHIISMTTNLRLSERFRYKLIGKLLAFFFRSNIDLLILISKTTTRFLWLSY